MTNISALQNPESKTAEQYSARNRFVKELTALGITFDHYGGCKYGAEADSAQLPPPHKVCFQRPFGCYFLLFVMSGAKSVDRCNQSIAQAGWTRCKCLSIAIAFLNMDNTSACNGKLHNALVALLSIDITGGLCMQQRL